MSMFRVERGSRRLPEPVMSLRVADDVDTRGFLTRCVHCVALDVVPALFFSSWVDLVEMAALTQAALHVQK